MGGPLLPFSVKLTKLIAGVSNPVVGIGIMTATVIFLTARILSEETRAENRPAEEPKKRKIGNRTQTDKYCDESSSRQDEERRGNNGNNNRGMTNVSSHLFARISRLIRLAGYLQSVEERTNIPRNQIIREGPSQYQDTSSGLGTSVHASHVIRLGSIHPEIINHFPTIHQHLAHFLGHTQNVPAFANYWGGLGGVIDRIQATILNLLSEVDFSSSLSSRAENILIEVRQTFIDTLRSFLEAKKGVLSPAQCQEIIEAIKMLGNFSPEEMFEKGKKGYDGNRLY